MVESKVVFTPKELVVPTQANHQAPAEGLGGTLPAPYLFVISQSRGSYKTPFLALRGQEVPKLSQ